MAPPSKRQVVGSIAKRERFRTLSPVVSSFADLGSLGRIGVRVGLAFLFATVFVGLATLSGVLGLAWLLAFAPLVALLRWFPRSALTVGMDGVLVSSLRGNRFIRFDEILQASTCVSANDRLTGVQMALHSGELLRWMIAGEPSTAADLVGHIHEGMAPGGVCPGCGTRNEDDAAFCKTCGAGLIGREKREQPAALLALLTEPGKTGRERVEALRGLGAGVNTTFRRSEVLPETLWTLVEDSSAPAEARAAAAVALTHSAGEMERARLRVAAETTAAPKLRVALEAAAGGDDDALAAALEEVRSIRATSGAD